MFDYSSCLNNAGSEFSSSGSNFDWKKVDSKTCVIKFNILDDLVNPLMYYRLTNFYQNHRLYVKSVEPDQLSGSALTYSEASNCDPLVGPDNQTTIVYYPCGLVANSYFNDTFSGLKNNSVSFEFSSNGIAWPSDLDKFKPTSYKINQVVAPLFWRERADVNADGTYKTLPDFSKDERFMVWMRIAGLPNFRKLYGKYQGTIPKGTYEVEIRSLYPVAEFDGTKSLVISTVSWMGGKNNFLGIAYIVVGGISLLLGFVFLFRHLVAPRRLGDHRYLSWNQDASTTSEK